MQPIILIKVKFLNFFLEHDVIKKWMIIDAAEAGNQSLVDDLIRRSSDKNFAVQVAARNMAVRVAARHNHRDLTEHLLSVHDANINDAIFGAAEAGNQSLVDDLIRRGADKNVAVWCAAQYDQHDLMEHL